MIPPEDWINRGIIYTDSDSRSHIVCYECQKPTNNSFFDGYITGDATSFWRHVEVNHLQEYGQKLHKKFMKKTVPKPQSINNGSNTRKTCVERTNPEKIEKSVEIIVIDDDDDEEDNAKEATLQTNNNQKPVNEKNVPANIDDIEKELSRICGEIDNGEMEHERYDCSPLSHNQDNNLQLQKTPYKLEKGVMPYINIPTPEASPKEPQNEQLAQYNATNNSTPTSFGRDNMLIPSLKSDNVDKENNISKTSVNHPIVTSQGDLRIRISWNNDIDILNKKKDTSRIQNISSDMNSELTHSSSLSRHTEDQSSRQSMVHSKRTENQSDCQNINVKNQLQDRSPSQNVRIGSEQSNQMQGQPSPQRIDISNGVQVSQAIDHSNRTEDLNLTLQNISFPSGTENMPSQYSNHSKRTNVERFPPQRLHFENGTQSSQGLGHTNQIQDWSISQNINFRMGSDHSNQTQIEPYSQRIDLSNSSQGMSQTNETQGRLTLQNINFSIETENMPPSQYSNHSKGTNVAQFPQRMNFENGTQSCQGKTPTNQTQDQPSSHNVNFRMGSVHSNQTQTQPCYNTMHFSNGTYSSHCMENINRTQDQRTLQNKNFSSRSNYSPLYHTLNHSSPQRMDFSNGTQFSPSPQYINHSNQIQDRSSSGNLYSTSGSEQPLRSQILVSSNRTQVSLSPQRMDFSNGFQCSPSYQAINCSKRNNYSSSSNNIKYSHYRAEKSKNQSIQNCASNQNSLSTTVQSHNNESTQNSLNTFRPSETAQNSTNLKRRFTTTSSNNDLKNSQVANTQDNQPQPAKISKRRQSYLTRPFKCSQCWIRCSSEKGRETHEQNFHNKDCLTECTICNKSVNTHTYDKHVKNNHNTQIAQ